MAIDSLPVGTATFLPGDVLAVLPKLVRGSYNLIISSPPYNIGKNYERTQKMTFQEYVAWQDRVISLLVDCVAENGSICWQVGSYVRGGESFPLDIYFYDSFKKRGMRLRNRIIWKFNFGLHSSRRFSGRYETLLWFTKSDNYKFNLDPVRVPQLYPGKRHSKTKGSRQGTLSGNPKGKNPGDYWDFSASEHFLGNPVWDIPNVKANHPEKTFHPCQFPIELAERCILALTSKGDSVLDPFVGTGTSVIAAVKHGRNGVGVDKDLEYLRLANKRVAELKKGTLEMRALGRTVHRPRPTDKVAMRPREWLVR